MKLLFQIRFSLLLVSNVKCVRVHLTQVQCARACTIAPIMTKRSPLSPDSWVCSGMSGNGTKTPKAIIADRDLVVGETKLQVLYTTVI